MGGARPAWVWLFIGDSTIRNKHEVHVKHNPTWPPALYVAANSADCTLPALPRDANVTHILWNCGLHVLHLEPYRPRGIPSLAAYREALDVGFRQLRAAYPRARLTYKFTNHVCDEAYAGDYARGARDWRQRRVVDGDAYALQMTHVGTIGLNAIEALAVRAWGVSSIDSGTHFACAYTAHRDGRHYGPLIPDFLHRLYATWQARPHVAVPFAPLAARAALHEGGGSAPSSPPPARLDGAHFASTTAKL